MNVTAIVPAAGAGERMQHRLKKSYISLGGQPILARTLQALDGVESIQNIIVAVSPGDEQLCRQEVLVRLALRAAVQVVAGGATRHQSVARALALVPDSTDIVIIHDGARPLGSGRLIKAVLALASTRRAATAAVTAKDSIAEVSWEQAKLIRALPREPLGVIQTPQAFERALLLRAHAQALQDGFQGTDDASLVLRLGIPVAVAAGSYTNIKITTQDDLLLAELMLQGGKVA